MTVFVFRFDGLSSLPWVKPPCSARGLLVVAKLRRRGIQIYSAAQRCKAPAAHARQHGDGFIIDVVRPDDTEDWSRSPSNVTLQAEAPARVGRPPDFDCCGLGNTRAPSTARRDHLALAEVARPLVRNPPQSPRLAGTPVAFAACESCSSHCLGNVPPHRERPHMAQTTATLLIEVLYARHSFRIGRGSGRKRPAD